MRAPSRRLAPPTAHETPDPPYRGEYRAQRWLQALQLLHRASSCAFQIRLPGVDRHLEAGIGLVAPQLAAVERHGVEPLRVLAGADRVAVRKDVKTHHTFDAADMP